MTKIDSHIWLKEGAQSKITPKIKEICSKFNGDDLEKIFKILNWIDKNMHEEKDRKKVLKLFSTRTADQLVKDKNDIDCHDSALLMVTFLRAVGIPAKYLVGIDKVRPTRGGHCVAEAYVGNRWILIDPTYFQLNLVPSRSHFYNQNWIVKEGKDSWACGIKTHSDWKRTSDNLVKRINKDLAR